MGADRRWLAAASCGFGTPIGVRDERQNMMFQHGRQGDAATSDPGPLQRVLGRCAIFRFIIHFVIPYRSYAEWHSR